MHRVGLGGPGEDGAAADDPPKARVGRDLPVDRHRPGRHPTVGLQSLGREPGPQHHPTRRRVARGDPESERVPTPLHRDRPSASEPVGNQQGSHGTTRGQEAAATQPTACRCRHDS
jgi:hypothetical protein